MPWRECGLSGLSRSRSALMTFWVVMAVSRFRGKCSDGTGWRVIWGSVRVWWFWVVNPLALGVGLVVGLLVVLPLSRRLGGVVGFAPIGPFWPRFPGGSVLRWWWIVRIWGKGGIIGWKFDWLLPGIWWMVSVRVWRKWLEFVLFPSGCYFSPSRRCGSQCDRGTWTSTSWGTSPSSWWWSGRWSRWPITMGMTIARTAMGRDRTFVRFPGCGTRSIGSRTVSCWRWRQMWRERWALWQLDGCWCSTVPWGGIGAVATGFSWCSFMVVTIASLTCLMRSVVSKLVVLGCGGVVDDGSGAWTGGCAGGVGWGIGCGGWWAGINWLRWLMWVWACEANCCFSIEFCSFSWAIWIWSNWFWACDWAWDCWCIISPPPNWLG